MSKLCSVIPQVFNGTEYVDSKLFVEINTTFKNNGLKGVALRNETTERFNQYHSKDFINTFGDWSLYQSVKFNKLSDEQANVFNIVYNGDINNLEKTLDLSKLNDLHEPILDNTLITEPIQVISNNKLTNKPIVTFNSLSDIINMSQSLGLSDNAFINNILGTKDIYITDRNTYYTNKLLDRVAQQSDSIGVLYGLEQNNDNDKVQLSTDNLSHSVEALEDSSDKFNLSEIDLISKLTASLLISDFQSLKDLFQSLSDSDLNNFIQNQKINQFIVDKINDFSNNIKNTFDDKIANTDSEIEKKVLQSKRDDLLYNYNNLMDTLEYQDEQGNYSFVYRAMLATINKDYNIAVRYENEMLVTESDGENGYITEELNKANWNDRDALSINHSNTVSQELKFLIAQCISTDYVASVTGQYENNSKYGINTPLSINDVWSTFIGAVTNNSTKESIINSLRSINVQDYNGNITTFINTLENDSNLWNSFYSNVVLSVVSVKKLQMGTSQDGNHVILENKEANYNAFAKNISLQQLKITLQLKLEKDEQYLNSIIANKNNASNIEMFNPNVTLQETINAVNKLSLESINGKLNKYQWIENRIKHLGLSDKVSMNDIHLFVSGLLGYNTNIHTDPFSKTLQGNLSPIDKLRQDANKETNVDKKNELLSQVTDIENKYNQVYSKVINDLVYLTSNLVSLKSTKNFNKGFNERSSINYLSNIISIKNYKNVSLSYFNENGDMEYSPQYPSFLTTLLGSIIPLNGEINVDLVKDKLSDYLSDKSLAKNDFLYNYNGSGLFEVYKDEQGNVQIDSNTGLPNIHKVTPINQVFVDNIRAYQLSGVMYKDTNKGAKYEYVTGDSWKIVQIQSALRGEFIIPSSDSSRSYVISMPKYGLKNIFTGASGNYVSYSKILETIGLLDKDGNIVRRKLSDLNEDSLAYDETLDTNKNVISIKYNTIKNTKLLYGLEKLDYATVLKADDKLIQNYYNFKNSKQIQAIRRTVDVETQLMQDSYNKMFDVVYKGTYNDNGEFIRYVDHIKPKDEIQKQANNGLLSSPIDYSGKRNPSKYDSKGLEIKGTAKLMDGINPNGRIFQFHRLSYNDSINGKITLNEFAKQYIHTESYQQVDLIDLVARMNKETHPIKNIVTELQWAKMSDEDKANNITATGLRNDIVYANNLFDKIFYNFLDKVFVENQKRLTNETSAIADELKSMVVDYVPPYISGTYEGGDNTFGKRRANLISMHLERNIKKSEVKSGINESFDEAYTPAEIQRQYNRSMLETFINDYISSTNIGEDILYGRQFEYKGFKDINKRVNEVIKNGKSNDSDVTFKSLTIADVETVSNMLNELKSNNDTNSSLLWEQYGKEMEVGNGLSMITVDEYIKRLKAVNMYYGKMKDYIDALTNPNIKFDTNKYQYIAEQLKYYLYSRQANIQGLHKGLMTSYQEKNSTIILFPKMFKSTQYEPVINWMNEKGIDELNFLSASKVGGQPVYQLHDTYRSEVLDNKQANTNYNVKTFTDAQGNIKFDDRIDRNGDYTTTNRVDINPYLITYKQSALRIQQDTVPHIYNEEGVLSTQFLKKTWVNMNDSDEYEINGVTYKGRTYSNKDGERGIFENMQTAMSFNAEQDRDILINLWGGIKDGQVQYDNDGNIDLDIKKVTKSIQKYVEAVGDISLMRAFEPTQLGNMTQLSLNHPTIYRQIESLLQAKISDNVRQKLSQIHAPIIPDTFIAPSSYKYNKDSVIRDVDLQSLKDNGHISYSKDFLDSQIGQKQFELKSEYYDSKGVFHPAQIITNVWDSKFEEYRTTKTVNAKDSINYDASKPTYDIPSIDIDSIPKEARTVVGTRIPHEGMQSSFIAEVVGFMNDDSSQIIVPKHLSKRTGWDYDIDTVYIYPKHLYKRNNELQPISFEYDNTHEDGKYNTRDTQLLDYTKTYYSKEYNTLKQLKLKSINDTSIKYQSDIQNVLNSIYRDKQVSINKINSNKEGSISNDERTNSLNETIRSTESYTEGINSIANNIIQNKDLNTKYTSSEINKLIDSLDNNFNSKTFTYVSNEQQIEASNKLKDLKLQFKTDINNIQNKYNDDLESLIYNKESVARFDTFDKLKQVTRETRNNMVVDTLQARLQAKFSTTLREKPNEYATLGTVSGSINDIMGLDNASSNFANLLDRTTVANMNRDVAVLKAQSVSNDNIYAVLGTIKSTVGENQAIPIVIMQDEFKDTNIDNIKNTLNKLVGRNNYNIDGDRITVFSQHLGNNATGDWMNNNGNNITSQSSQITSNILDAVKDNLGFNVGSTTLNVMSILANSPISHYTDILASTKQDNAFAYSNLIIHQAIISKYLAQINSNQRTSEFANKNNAMIGVRNEVYSNMIELLQNYDIMQGKLEDTHVGILDLFRTYTKPTKENPDLHNAHVVENIGTWLQSLSQGRGIIMSDRNAVSMNTTFNELIKFVQTPELIEQAAYMHLQQYGKEAIDIYENNKTTDNFKEINISSITNKSIFSHNKKEGFVINNDKSFKSISELNNLYTSSVANGYYNIDSKTEELKHGTLENIIPFVNFLDEQIAVSKLYEHIDSTGNIIQKATKVLRTDKLGTSPNSSVTSQLFEDLSKLYLDLDTFTQNMKLSKAYTTDEINNFVNEYSKQSTLIGKRNAMEIAIANHESKLREVNDSNGQSLNLKGKLVLTETPLYADNIPIVQSVFPNVVANTMDSDFDFRKSSYPYFEAQLVYANHFSTKAFSKILIAEKPEMKRLLNVLMARLNVNTNIGNTNKANVRGDILNTIINDYIYNNVEFFNGGFTDAKLRNTEKTRVIGLVKLEKIERKVNDTIKLVDEVDTSNILDNFDVYTNMSLNGKMTLDMYKSLSTANQVYLLQSNLTHFANQFEVSDQNDIKDFLNIFQTQLDKENLAKNGYHVIKTLNVDRDSRKMKQTFTKMLYNNNPFIRQTARDLVRYAFHTSGLKFGNNVAKYIDISLYYKDITSFYNINSNINEEMNKPVNQLFKYNGALKQLENSFDVAQDDSKVEYYLDNIRSQMYDNNLITPLVYDKKKNDQPTFKNLVKVVLTSDILENKQITLPIIQEQVALLKNSIWSKNETIRTKIEHPNFQGNYAFKRFDINGSTNVYYYPIAKSLASEFADYKNISEDPNDNRTIVSKYTNNIKTPQEYENLITQYDSGRVEKEESTHNVEMLFDYDRSITNDARAKVNTDDYQYTNLITKSNLSYSETAKRIIDNVDNVLYIGNNEFNKKAFASDNTIYSTLDTINGDTLNSIEFDKPTKLAIVGDGLSDSKLTQQEIDNIIVPTIRSYNSLFNIDEIKTIFKTGIGEAVYKATMTNNNSNEYIEVGSKNNIHNVEELSDDSVANNIIRESISDIDKIITSETKAFALLNNLQTYAREMQGASPDTYVFPQDGLKDIIANMKDSDNQFNGLMSALEVNSQGIDKILEFMQNDGIMFPNESKVTNILNINIFKYINGDNTNNKTIVAKKLVLYNNILKVAKQLLNVDELTTPKYTVDEWNQLSPEQKQKVSLLAKQISVFNNTVKEFKKTTAYSSTGVALQPGYSKGDYVNVLSNQVDAKIKQYFATLIYIYSRNPKFGETKFAKTSRQIIEQGFTDTEGKEISPEALSKLYQTALLYNDDLNFVQTWMDSIRDTGIPLIDNTMALYSELKLQSLKLEHHASTNLEMMLDKYNGLFNKSTNYSASRSASMQSKFFDTDKGEFISDYDYSKFNKDLEDKTYAARKDNEFVNMFTSPKVNTVIYSKYKFKGTNLTTLDNVEEQKDTNIKLRLDQFKKVFSEGKITVDAMLQNLSNDKNNDSELPQNNIDFNYHNVFSIKDGDTIKNVVLQTKINGKLGNTKGVPYSLFIESNGKYESLESKIENYKTYLADGEENLEEHSLGYTADLKTNAPDLYNYHSMKYFERGLDTNSVERKAYEDFYHIKFDDVELREGKIYADGTQNYSHLIPIISNERTNTNLNISQVIPVDSYINQKYERLSDEEKVFLRQTKLYIKNTINDVFPGRIHSESFTPYIFLSQTPSIGKILKNAVGWRAIQEQHVESDMFGKDKYFFQSNVLTKPELQNSIKVKRKQYDETFSEYETNVVNDANKQLAYLVQTNKIKDTSMFANKDDKGIPYFSTYDEVKTYNQEVFDSFMKDNASRMNYDIPSVLKAFTEELYNLKPNVDFDHSYKLLTDIVNSDDFQARSQKVNGKYLMDMAMQRLTGEREFISKHGRDTNAATALENWKKVLYKVSRTDNKFDQIMQLSLRYTSVNTMWLNVHTGIKNVVKGSTDLIIEAAGNEFINRKDLGKGMNEYRKDLSNILGSVGLETSPSLISAIIKRYNHLFEDHTEGKLKSQTSGTLTKITNKTEAIAYATMTGGEHFLQFSNVIAMLHSHRLVNGSIMSRNEYIGDRKEKVIRQFLNEKQNKDLDTYIDSVKKLYSENYKIRDYISDWMIFKNNDLSDETKKKITVALKDAKAKALEEFEGKPNKDGSLKLVKYKTLFEYFKYDDQKVKLDTRETILNKTTNEQVPNPTYNQEIKNYNYGKLIVDDAMTTIIENEFTRRVQALNQSIHGIYNTIDRNGLQNMLIFEVVFQFRKWMRANWIRYMGVKGNYNITSKEDNNPFSERLGQYRSGAFQDFFRFMKSPFIKTIAANKDAGMTHPVLTAFTNTFAAQAEFFKNISFYYNMLSAHEQANIKRTAQFAANALLITGALFMAGLGYDPDKDKDKFFKPHSWFIYQLAGLQTEYLDLIPVIGWATFYKQTKTSTVPMEMQLVNLSKLCGDVAGLTYRSDADKLVKAGIYRGESKVKIDLEKSIPVLRQWHKEHYLSQSINYYGMFNPFVNSGGGSSNQH